MPNSYFQGFWLVELFTFWSGSGLPLLGDIVTSNAGALLHSAALIMILIWQESKTEPSVEKTQNYMRGGGATPQKNFDWKGGTPHIPFWWVEQMGWGHRTTLKENIYWDGGTPHILCCGGDTSQYLQKKLSWVVGGWVGGWVGGPSQRIMPLCGSILQAGTCQILSLAEYPR